MEVVTPWTPKFPHYTSNGDKPPYMKPKSIKPFAMVISASRNTGKSHLFRDIYKRCFHERGGSKFDVQIVFSNSLANGWYQSFIDTELMFDTYDPEILKIHEKEVDTFKEKHGWYPNSLVIFDDCIGNSVKYSDQITQLFTRGRHKGISICFITQSPVLIQTTWRANVTHGFFLRCKGTSLDHIVSSFLSDLPSEEELNGVKAPVWCRSLCQKIWSERYRTLVVCYEDETDKMSDFCYSYKAKG